MTDNDTLTAVDGIAVGHAQDLEAATGCTIILCEHGAVPGVFILGGAAGTRDFAPLAPDHIVERVHAVFLSGGSAFGLDAAAGVMKYLENHDIGFMTSAATVPIVPAAIIYDLAIGRFDHRPTPAMAISACKNASRDPCAEGVVGAGTGATVGKVRGMDFAMKSGLGSALRTGRQGERVGALVVVNAFGDIRDPRDDAIIAGARTNDGAFLDTAAFLRGGEAPPVTSLQEHTTLAVIATDVPLTKGVAAFLARMAAQGLAKTISPCPTPFDGDVVITLSTAPPGRAPRPAPETAALGALASAALEDAVVRAVRHATGLAGVPSLSDLAL